MTDKWTVFLLGVAGSASVELLAVLNAARRSRPLAQYYRSPTFWGARTALALVGGILALAYDVHNGILAFHIGAATPLIVDAMGRTMPE